MEHESLWETESEYRHDNGDYEDLERERNGMYYESQSYYD